LRTGWLFGGNINHNKNFVYKRYLEAKEKNIIYADNTQIGNPTYVVDFVEQINTLIEYQQHGVFNCVNKANNLSRYDYIKKIIEYLELNCTVNIAPQKMFKRVAPVSKNESATNYKLDLLNLNIMDSWKLSLKKYILQLKEEI